MNDRDTMKSKALAPPLKLSIFDGSQEVTTVNLSSFGKEIVTFGRAEDNDIVLRSQFISKSHGFFRYDRQGWTICDNNSKNGIFVDGCQIGTALLMPGASFRIDNPYDPAEKGVVFLVNSGAESGQWQSLGTADRSVIVIGRSPDCDIVLPHVGVSLVHARIENRDGRWCLIDCSTNGISINGRMVHRMQWLREKDLIIITNTKLIFTQQRITWLYTATGIGLDAVDIVHTVKSKAGLKNITNHVTLSIKPCEFVAIVGGSGAGKSTFLNCISGYVKATSGAVIVGGEDLYSNYQAMKTIIGYVPQQDIVYDNLTLGSMLDYAARLRMPTDTSEAERSGRVKDVLALVELAGHDDTYIRQLSGGQKKRASIAVELLSDPNLFFLDEPTSGLDPGTERNLMHTLRKMSDNGVTVVLVTHNTLNLHLCDKVIFLGKGGNLCFCGSPDAALTHFGVDNMVDIYNLLDSNTPLWAQRYDISPNKSQPQFGIGAPAGVTSSQPKAGPSFIRQLSILCSRYLKLITNDRQRLIMLLAQAVLLGFLLKLVSNSSTFVQYNNTKAIVFGLACSAFWIGILNAIQEICKERSILKREYSTSLNLYAYVLSKFVVLGLLCFVQSLLLTGVFAVLVGLPDQGVINAPFIEFFLSTYLCMLSAMGMGLLASSLFNNPDRAMTVAPVLLMPQILFSGLAFKLTGAIKSISAIITCRWSIEALGTSANLNNLPLDLQEQYPMITHLPEDFFDFTARHFSGDLLILLGTVLIFIIVSILTTKNSLRQK